MFKLYRKVSHVRLKMSLMSFLSSLFCFQGTLNRENVVTDSDKLFRTALNVRLCAVFVRILNCGSIIDFTFYSPHYGCLRQQCVRISF